VLAFAGIWDVWKAPDVPAVHSCAIITVAANEDVRRFHDRMPAILPPEQFADWLNPSTNLDTARRLLQPAPIGLLQAQAVSRIVNKAGVDIPQCIEPI